MNLSKEELNLVISETRELLLDARIKKIKECEDDTVIFKLKNKENKFFLLISTFPGESRMNIVEDIEKYKVATPGSFVMFLRKYITGAQIFKVEQMKGERVVIFSLRRDNDVYFLIFECSGHHPNLFLTTPNYEILAMQKKSQSKKRDLIIGQRYVPPPPPEKSSQVKTNILRFFNYGKELFKEIEDFYDKIKTERKFKELYTAVYQKVKSLKRHEIKKLEKIKKDYEKAIKSEENQKFGDLIKFNLQKLKKGMTSVYLVDPRDNKKYEVKLDPALNPVSNMQKYYKLASKYKKQKNFIEKRLKETEKNIEKLDGWIKKLLEIKSKLNYGELQAFVKENFGDTFFAPKKERRKERIEVKRLPYKEFFSSDGTKILVGKSAKDNEKLTFSVARGRDIWLHARDYQGSHVIIVTEKDKEVSRDTLIDAAILAGLYSKGKNEKYLDIVYTNVKYVRKVKGAPPGTVSFSQSKNIQVDLTDKRRISRLFKRNRFI